MILLSDVAEEFVWKHDVLGRKSLPAYTGVVQLLVDLPAHLAFMT